MNIRRMPIRNVSTISENTKNILESLQKQGYSNNVTPPPEPYYITNNNQIPFKKALASGKYTPVGMGLWQSSAREDYGKIWVKKTIVDEKTGAKQEYLVVYTNDDDEIIRQVASEYNKMQKVAAIKKANEDKVPLQLVGQDGNAFSILGRFQSAARKAGWDKERIKAVMDEAMSGDYNNLLVTMMKYTYDPTEEDYDEFDDMDEINNDDYDELEMDDDSSTIKGIESDIKTDFNLLIGEGKSEDDAIQEIVNGYGRTEDDVSSKKTAWKNNNSYFLKEEDPYVEGYEDRIGNYREGMKVKVYEFPSEELMINFLEEVGGMPHPFGGKRVILSNEDDVSSKKTAFNKELYIKYPNYRKYFNTLQGLKDTFYYGKPMIIQNGSRYLMRQHPELDETAANKLINLWLGEGNPYGEARTAAAVDPKNIPIAPGIKSKNLSLDESGGAGTGTVTVEFTDVSKALKFYQEDISGASEGKEQAAQEEKKDVNEELEGVQQPPQPQAPVQQGQQPPIPQVQPKASSLNKKASSFDNLRGEETLPNGYVIKMITLEDTNWEDPEGFQVVITVTKEDDEDLMDEPIIAWESKPMNGYEFDQERWIEEASREFERVKQEYSSKQASLRKKADDDSYGFNYYKDEDETADQFGQFLHEGDRVKDDMGRRGQIDRIVGDAVYVIWGGPFEGAENENRAPVLMDAKQLTKWSNLKSTVANFSDGVKGVKVIRYSNYNPNFSTSVWQLLNRERTNTHAISQYSSNTSYINENGMEIPVSLRKGIKVGEMFERPDNHELVRFAGWIEKTAVKDNGEPEDDYNDIHDTIDSYKDTDEDLSNELVEDYKNKNEEEASIDIHVEADPSIIEEILDTIMEEGDEEELEGGLGDNKKDEEFDDEQLEKGKDVEKEHTDDEDLAKEIAKDHLTEMDDYYDKLEDMEKKESSIVNEDGKWKVKNEAKTKTLGTHDTKAEAEKQLQAIEINKHKESNLKKKSDHYMSPNFGLWVASLGNSLQGEKADQYHNILAQFLPEFGHDDYSEIVRNTDQLQVEQKKQLESYLYDLIGRQEFANLKLSFDDPYDTQSDFYNDRGSYDQFLTPPDKELTIGDRVRVTEESTDMFGEEGVIADKLEFNGYRVNINGEDYKFYKDEITKISGKTAADISDQVPPMSNVTDESRTDSPAPNQQPLPPRQELNSMPGDVLYDSNQKEQGAGKFQVTTDPVEKTVTVKFLDQDKEQALNNLMGNPQQQPNPLMQPTQNPPTLVPGQEGFQPQKDFQDTNSGVQF